MIRRRLASGLVASEARVALALLFDIVKEGLADQDIADRRVRNKHVQSQSRERSQIGPQAANIIWWFEGTISPAIVPGPH
jgi:hypothetical protein